LTEHMNQDSVEKAEEKPLPQNLKAWEGSSAVVQQGRHWSSALILISSTLFGVIMIWSFVAKIDQTISVRGRLQPVGSVLEVDSPSSGVVRKVFVKDGQFVQVGQPLLEVEAKGLASRRQAIEQTLKILNLQAASINSVIESNGISKNIAAFPNIPLVEEPVLAQMLVNARSQIQQITAQLRQIDTRLSSRQESLVLKQKIADDIKPLYQSGAMARNSYLSQLNEVQELRAEISTLKEEKIRIVGSASNQLTDINRQAINLNSELVGLKETISYRTISAPSSGRIFDSKVGPFSVVSADQVVLKIVPENKLQAVVDISNVDVGFVKTGMQASVSVDSFPSGEFGYIKGLVTKIGSDALKPDQLSNQFRFPAVVSLQQQRVIAGDKELNLQSGMAVTANIKLRSRPAISIVTDLFTKQFEGIKQFR